MRGLRLLKRYLKSHSLSAAEFCRVTGGRLTEPQMCRYLSGENKPDVASSLIIAEVTRDAVPVAAWVSAAAMRSPSRRSA